MQVTIHNDDIDAIVLYADTSCDGESTDMAVWVIDGDLCLVEPDFNPVNGTYVGIVKNIKISDLGNVLIERIT